MKQINPQGRLSSKIAVVGECPTEEDVRNGRPFSGYSGRLFHDLLANQSISPTDIYLTFLFKKPTNALLELNATKAAVHPTPAYLEAEAALYEELKNCDANVILAMGQTPLYALTRYLGITKYRGSILAGIPETGGKKVVATLTPSSAISQDIYRYYIAHDISRLREECKSPELVLPKRTYLINPTLSEALEYLERCRESKLVAFDIETMKKNYLACISFSFDPLEAMSIPLMCRGGSYWDPDQELTILTAISSLLEDEEVVKVGQNANFDATFMYENYGMVTYPLEDTMAMHNCLYPDFPKGLDFMTSIWTREPYYKDEGKDVMRGLVDNDVQFWTYNAKDSALTLEIFLVLRRKLEAQKNLETYQRQFSLQPACMYMQERGIRMDVEAMKAKCDEIDKELALLKEAFKGIAPFKVNPNSNRDLAKLFYTYLKQKPYRKGGSVSLNNDALIRLERKGIKEASLVRAYRKANKFRSTYLKMRLDPDNRLRCFFNPGGTVTGRLSSSQTLRGTGGNTQNQPPQMKEYMLADPDHILYTFDLSQAENRCVAYLAQEERMIKAFESGADIHSNTYALLFGISPEEVSAEPGSSHFGQGTKSQRDWGKACNHSLNYNLGYKAFGIQYVIPEAQAKDIHSRYHATYPNVKAQFHAKVQRMLREGRIVTNFFGRKRVFFGRLDQNLYLDAYAQIPQSSVADKITVDGIRYLFDEVEEADLINQVHDSIVFQLHTELGPERHYEIIQGLRARLESPMPEMNLASWKTQPFSIPCDGEMGLNLGKKGLRSVPLNSYDDFYGVWHETLR